MADQVDRLAGNLDRGDDVFDLAFERVLGGRPALTAPRRSIE
jgi:hypothetical protein